MSHVVKHLVWAVIDIDLEGGRVFFQQRWQYEWLVKPPTPPWTLAEKRLFHTTLDRQIWDSWSNQATLSVAGPSAFARRFQKIGVPINLDVRWVTQLPHWHVEVRKWQETNPSEVKWNEHRVILHATDTAPYTACTSAAPQVCKAGFRTFPHEFGHAAGNTAVLNRGDEYKPTSAFLADTDSIMNIGHQLRARHFRTIIEELNSMLPGCTFSVSNIH